jgi:hypothetical protein
MRQKLYNVTPWALLLAIVIAFIMSINYFIMAAYALADLL